MEVGNEISNKIRSAIKAKLIDLDVYVDEELPDYIMVMVANKKSQNQMTEDLSLFLGKNTETFTTWLHSLLQKLQSITSESTNAAVSSKAETSVEAIMSKDDESSSSRHKKHAEKEIVDESKHRKRSSDEGTDDKKRRKSDQEKKSKTDDQPRSKSAIAGKTDSSTTDKPDTVANEAVEKITSSEKTTELEKVDSVISLDGAEKISSNKPELAKTSEIGDPKKTTETTNIPVAEDDDLAELLLTEVDELTEELERETSTVIIPPKKSDSDSRKTALVTISDEEVRSKPQRGAASIIISSDSSKDYSPPQSSRPKAVTSPIRQTVRRSAIIRAVEPRPSELSTRKRRGPISVIGSVTHDSEEEEGYDPRNPAVGNVASVVKVTARKSSVPPKLQANK